MLEMGQTSGKVHRVKCTLSFFSVKIVISSDSISNIFQQRNNILNIQFYVPVTGGKQCKLGSIESKCFLKDLIKFHMGSSDRHHVEGIY